METPNRLSLISKMDLDSDLTAVQQGYCRLARNVIRTRGKAGKGTAMRLTLGNKKAFYIGNVTSQNKQYRIYIPPQTLVNSTVVRVKSPDGSTSGPTYTITLASSPQDWSSQINAQGGAATYSGNATNGGYVTFNYSAYQFFDYLLEVDPYNDADFDVVCVRECIPTNLAGRLVPIASADLDGKSLFVWSTSQRNRPTQIDNTVIGVTLNGPTTALTMSATHDIQVGEHINITHSASVWLNGTHTVVAVGANTITIATAQVFTGTAIPSFTFGSEKIFKNPYGICEVGVAQYDDSADVWTYRRLLRSKEFDMNTLNTVDVPTAEKDNYKVSLYWTDGADVPRAMYVVGSTFSTDMCLRHLNSDNLYFYGHIHEATQHILPQARCYVDYVEQKQDGGALKAGMKRYTARLLNKYLVPTDWSSVSGPVPVYGPTTALDNDGNRVIGSEAGEPTGKINVMRIEDINRYVYDFVEIACINYAGGSAPNAVTLCRLPTGIAKLGQVLHAKLNYQHDGYETETDLALADIIDLSSDLFDTAKSECALDGRAVFSNLSMSEEDDLTAWAKTFKHRVMVKEIQESRDNALTKVNDTDPNETPYPRPQVGEYQLAENVFRYVGYMDNDTYRFGCMLRERKTGRWTRVFWVDDISMDAYDINIKGNPSQFTRRGTDNAGVEIWLPNVGGTGFSNYFTRRKQDWALTAGLGSDIDTTEGISAYTTMCKPMVTYVEFYDADMSTSIGGVPIRQKYDRIRFVRPDTVKKVLTTGYGVLGVSHPSMFMLPTSDMQQESFMPAGAGNSMAVNYMRSKLCLYGEQNKAIHEWPFFCGGMPIPSTPFYSQTLLSNVPILPTLPQAPTPSFDNYLQCHYPLNANIGDGFGVTVMRSDGSWDEHLVGDPLTPWGAGNDWRFPSNRTPFTAFPNIVSFYSADHLFGGIDANEVKEGRYRMRVMSAFEEAVRTKVDATTAWGRAYNMMAEFHPRPSNPDMTDYGGIHYQIVRAVGVAHGSYTDVNSFEYTTYGVNEFTSLNWPRSSWPQNLFPPRHIDKKYHRNLAAFNLKKTEIIPSAAVDDWDGAANNETHNDDTLYWQKIERAMWHNSPCIMIQTPEGDGDYPKFSKAFAHYGSIVSGAANCSSFPPCPVNVLIEDGGGSQVTATGTPWNGASLSDYQNKRTNPIRDELNNLAGTGVFYAQLAREIEDPYGLPEQTIYKWVCAEFEINPSDTLIPMNTYSVFGGDTFTQGVYIKNRYMNESVRDGDPAISWDAGFENSYANEGIGDAARPGFGSGFKGFMQSRLNAQLRYTTSEQNIYLGDTVSRTYWLEETDAKKDLFTYSDAYTPLFNIQQFAPFISTLPKRRNMPTRIQWSSRKVMDGLGDGYREVKPLSFRDLDPTRGEISGHKAVNGELFSWQRDSFDRQFFNARGQLVSTADLNIVIGEADVMARDGVNMTVYGCTHRESIIKARTDGGKDVVFWFNANTQQFVRFGMDGTVVISERQPIASWLRENARWVRDEQSPHDTFGIRGVWDERYREAIWTFTGQRTVPTWSLAVNYPVGYAITYGSSGFNGFPDIYIAKRAHTSSEATEIGVGADWESFWELVPHTNPEYYTEFTIAWNEIANGFSTMYGMMPSIYMRWRDAFLTPNPQVRNSVYVHRVGETGVWWEESEGAGLVEDGYQEVVFNELPSEVKRYYAINVSSDESPDRIEFETEHHESYLNDDEFEDFEGMWRSPIKEDSTTTGVNDGDTSILFGRYLLSRIKIFARSLNTIREAVVKTAPRPRSVRR